MTANCAKCRTTALIFSSTESASVGRCPRCAGMWLELGDAAVLARAGAELPEPTTTPVQRHALDRLAGWCPGGHGVLQRIRIDMAEVFHLDHCRECDGTWFDPGEWNRLARANLLRKLDEFWQPGWEKRLRGANARRAHLRRVEQRVGRELFQQVLALASVLRRHPGAAREALAFLVDEVQLKQEERTYDGLVTSSGEYLLR